MTKDQEKKIAEAAEAYVMKFNSVSKDDIGEYGTDLHMIKFGAALGLQMGEGPETGFTQEHEAHRYRILHPAVDQMGGFANFKHWILTHAANYFKTCAELVEENSRLKARYDAAISDLSASNAERDTLKAEVKSVRKHWSKIFDACYADRDEFKTEVERLKAGPYISTSKSIESVRKENKDVVDTLKAELERQLGNVKAMTDHKDVIVRALERSKTQNEKLRTALKFYASDSYVSGSDEYDKDTKAIRSDSRIPNKVGTYGQTARQALKDGT